MISQSKALDKGLDSWIILVLSRASRQPGEKESGHCQQLGYRTKIKQEGVYFELDRLEKLKTFFQKQPELFKNTSDLILEPKTHFASERLHLICYLNSVSQPPNIHIRLIFAIQLPCS